MQNTDSVKTNNAASLDSRLNQVQTNVNELPKKTEKMTNDANDSVSLKKITQNSVKVQVEIGLKLFRKNYTTWYNQHGQAGVSLGKENYLINDHEFRKHFYKLFLNYSKPPLSSGSWNLLIKEFVNVCLFESELQHTYKRIALVDNSMLVYDHCDAERHVTVITANGRETITESPVIFLRTPDMAEQCLPANKGNIDTLDLFINVRHKHEAICLKAAIVKSFIPEYENPVVGIFGSQGSGKTTMLDFFMQIISPSYGRNITSVPSSESILLDIAQNNHCYAFDNVSAINDKQADMFCRIATGIKKNTGLVSSQSAQNSSLIKSMIFLNGINNLLLQPDLADRSIVVFTKPIKKRYSLDELQKAFSKSKPEIIAGIFDGISSYFKNKSTIQLESPPRMMDFAVTLAAAEEGLGWTKDTFIENYLLSIKSATHDTLETNLGAIAVLSYMKSHSDPSATMSAYSWVHTLKSSGVWDKSMASNPKAFSQELFKLELPLRAVGITLERIRTAKERLIKINYAYCKPKHSEIAKTDDLQYIEEPGRDEEGEQAIADIAFKNMIEEDKLISVSLSGAESENFDTGIEL